MTASEDSERDGGQDEATDTPTPSETATTTTPVDPEEQARAQLEADPVVQGLRAHYAALAGAVNSQDFASADLVATTTSERLEIVESLMTDDVGLEYPGPHPLQPLAVERVSETEAVVLFCVVGQGWAVDPASGVPPRPYEVAYGRGDMLLEGGVWKARLLDAEDGDACAGVQPPEELW